MRSLRFGDQKGWFCMCETKTFEEAYEKFKEETYNSTPYGVRQSNLFEAMLRLACTEGQLEIVMHEENKVVHCYIDKLIYDSKIQRKKEEIDNGAGRAKVKVFA